MIDQPDLTDPVITNPWGMLRRLTPARVALGRAGGSLPTRPQLDFQLAHARARDAVLLPLDFSALGVELAANGMASLNLESAASDRASYLRRPDLGRRLSTTSLARLAHHRGRFDLAVVVVDGLSSLAVSSHVVPMLLALQPLVEQAGWQVAPLALVANGRVAVGDQVALALGARMVMVLIGERPGLSSPDSLGIYLTYNPQPDTADSGRNCLSNIHANGMSYSQAAMRCDYLLREALRRGLTGVDLKDDSDPDVGVAGANFLLPNR